MAMVPGGDLRDYLLDNYGTCDRGADCYWGKDGRGRFDGCLRTGWRGRACEHWRPIGVIEDDRGLRPATWWQGGGDGSG